MVQTTICGKMTPSQFPLLLVTLVILVSLQLSWSPVDACSCMPLHPQTMFCEHAEWVIKAKVKTNRLINMPYSYTRKDGTVQTGEIQRRIMGVKISKVFKEFPGLSQGGFVRLYSAPSGSLCGSDLRINVTYLIQGRKVDGRLTFGLCDSPAEWLRIPPLMRRGYGYLYKKNCECKVRDNCIGPDCGCYMNRSWNYKQKQCYNENAVCVPDTSVNEIQGYNSQGNSCKWSKRGIFYRCMASNGDRPFEWEP